MFWTICQCRRDRIFIKSVLDRIGFECLVCGTAEIVHEWLQGRLKIVHVLLILMPVGHYPSSGRLRSCDGRGLCRRGRLQVPYVLYIRLRSTGGMLVAIDMR